MLQNILSELQVKNDMLAKFRIRGKLYVSALFRFWIYIRICARRESSHQIEANFFLKKKKKKILPSLFFFYPNNGRYYKRYIVKSLHKDSSPLN